jgi:hypothetical protein
MGFGGLAAVTDKALCAPLEVRGFTAFLKRAGSVFESPRTLSLDDDSTAAARI